MTIRQATLITSTVEILCPFCGEPQPNPDNGADTWTPAEMDAASMQRRECVSCDAGFRIVPHAKVQVVR